MTKAFCCCAVLTAGSVASLTISEARNKGATNTQKGRKRRFKGCLH